MRARLAGGLLATTGLLTLVAILLGSSGPERVTRLVALALVSLAIARGAVRRARVPSAAMVGLTREIARREREADAATTSSALAQQRADGRHRAREAFVAAVSHELRTPLNTILGFTQVLLDGIDGPLSPVQREDVVAIREAGAHLRALVEEVIDTSARKSVDAPALARVDLQSLVREIGRGLEAQLRGRPVTLRIVLSADLPSPIGDARRIRQILWNLGTNALKYTQRGEVVLAVARDGRDVRFSVTDHGRGILQADLDRIFADHERVEPSDAEPRRGRRSEGWGLGLAIAREMATFHGGRIEVESEVGRGSTFHFVMPCVGEEA